MGFSTSVSYKQWSVSTVLRASIGNYLYNQVFSGNGSTATIISPNSFIQNVPKAALDAGFATYQRQSDYYIYNASFLKMDNLGLSYNVGNIVNKKARLSIGAYCQNVFIVTKYPSIDPEVYSGVDNVIYNLQIDTASDFSSANKKVISVSKDLHFSILVEDLNDIMLNQLTLDTNVTYTLYMRVVSNLTNNTAKLVSNTVQLVSTPYAIPPKVAPPASGTLFIVGSATPGGWDNPISIDPKTQHFTQISPTQYEITIQITGSGEYKFISVNGSWNDQWSIATANDPTEMNGGDFVFNAANIQAPPASGKYKINVNFQTGKFSVVAQ